MIQWVFGFGRARWRHHWFGCGLWVSLSIWPWVVGVTTNVAMGHGSWLWCSVFSLGLLGSNGGSVSGYNGYSMSDLWCWVGYAVGCNLVKLQRWRDRDERDRDKILIFSFAILGFCIP